MSLSFQAMIAALKAYWSSQGCAILEPVDQSVGAGTFHPATFLKAIGPEPWSCAYVQPSRRPADGRYGDNPNRVQMHHQFQVVIKPSPHTFQALYLDSLRALGVDPLVDDIRFVEDNWESPTLGAWGLGWEVWQNGMEITQFTYFQQLGGLPCHPVMGEITYGLERLAMYLQDIDNVYDLVWTESQGHTITYGDVFLDSEKQMSAYNFEHADIEHHRQRLEQAQQSCQHLVDAALPLPAYEQVLTASHAFNMLDARGALSVTERQRLILGIRQMASAVAQSYLSARESLGFPLLGEPHEA